MPIDKFGRHLYSHEDPQTFLAEVRDFSQTIRCETVLTLLGVKTEGNGYFVLLGDQDIAGIRVFICPVNGIIKDIRLSLKEVEIFINEKLISRDDLIGMNMKEGDKISIKWSKINVAKVMLLQLILLSPIQWIKV